MGILFGAIYLGLIISIGIRLTENRPVKPVIGYLILTMVVHGILGGLYLACS